MLFYVYLLLALAAVVCFGLFAPGPKPWMLPLIFLGTLGVFLLLHALVLCIASLFAGRKEQLEEGIAFYKKLMLCSISAFLALGRVRCTLEGEEKLPKKGGFLLVCNHLSMFDPMAAMALLRKKGLVFITKKENISIPVGGPLIAAMGCPVLDRGDSRMAVRLMQQVARRMSAGEAIGVYPEGTRSKTGLLGDFKPGAFKCALWGKVPVVVAVIEGSEQVHKRFFFRSTHIRMRILEVLPYETLRTMDTGAISRQARAIMIEEGGLHAA